MRFFESLILIFTLLAATAGTQMVERQITFRDTDRYLVFPVRDSDPPVTALPRTKAILKQFEVYTLKSIWEKGS